MIANQRSTAEAVKQLLAAAAVTFLIALAATAGFAVGFTALAWLI